MLSAGSFSSPYEHLSQPETKRMVEHYTAYLSDNTRLIANPGLKVHNTHDLLSDSHLNANLSLKLDTHTHTQNLKDGREGRLCEIVWDGVYICAMADGMRLLFFFSMTK